VNGTSESLADYFVSVPAAPVQGPPPGVAPVPRAPQRSRRGMLLALLVVVLLGATGYVVATREPAPDRRPVELAETLDGLARASDPSSAEYRQQMEQSVHEWWPNRSAAFALYASDTSKVRIRDMSGPHVLAVRGRFGDHGDAQFAERRKKDGFTFRTEKQRYGSNSCETTMIVTVCWRETDRLSVSVLTLDSSEAERVSHQVDEVWNAVR
jgi:hypothetical protein